MTVTERIICVVCVFIVLGLLSGSFVYPFVTADTAVVTIQKLDHKVNFNSKTDQYLVFTNNGIFRNTDCWIRLKFDSSDLQYQLKEGYQYKIYYYGWRVRVLSWYPNIYKAERIGEN